MDEIFEIIKKIVDMLDLKDTEVNIDEERKRISIVADDRIVHDKIDVILPALDHIFGLVFRKHGHRQFILDVNYYRRERERLIEELARAAAKKAIITKTDVELPAMNAYERRLVHMEITTHPELRTESIGVGKERRVVIKRLDADQ